MANQRLHPRPQLVREGWTDLDGQWECRIDDLGIGLDERWWGAGVPFDRTITVPYPLESEASGVNEDGHSIVWYRREIALARPVDDARVLLHFGAVDYQADVWVNGSHVGSHQGGHVGFQFDITAALDDGTVQTIVVRAFDHSTSLEQPRGKQDWEAEPHAIWYRRTTGIWRQVWLETVSSSRIAAVRWAPGARPSMVTAEFEIAGSAPVELEVEFHVGDQHLARSSHQIDNGQLTVSFDLQDNRLDTEQERLLWSPERPTLIDVDFTVHRGGAIVDRATSYVGLRSVATEDHRFLLNNRPYFLRLVLEQAYWPQSHLAAPNDDAIQAEVQLIKDLGFNGVRMHQTVSDPRFLYWCDYLGLLVWADAPAAYRFTALAVERTTREWTEILRRDGNHPCIVTWVAFNESWGVPSLAFDPAQRHAVRGLAGILKALDPSRLVIGNDGWEYVAGDMLGIHDYTQSADLLGTRYSTREAVDATIDGDQPGGRRLAVARREKAHHVPTILSEFGGITFSTTDGAWEAYGTVSDVADLADRLQSLISAALASTGLAGFCYTQLTDTLQERNGLTDETRTPKADIATIRQIISAPRTVD